MFSLRCVALTTALLSLVASTSAFNLADKTNVAIYYGQGPNEKYLGLKEFCKNSNVDIIPLGFLDIYPAQGNGYPGTNFASSCTGSVYSGPGYNGTVDHTKDDLQSSCPTLVDGISFCQAQGKKILLSLGGAPGSTSYQLTCNADADYMADFLWGAFGPLDPSATWPRPFDDNVVGSQSVNGFDFDIEVIQPGEQQYYIRMINRLRSYFPTGPGAPKYLITGAPQCVVPDYWMGDIITATSFDILFVQYYNTAACSARNWVSANPSYPGVSENPSGFSQSWAQLQTFLDGGASKNAKIYFGLPGAPVAAGAGYYLSPSTEVVPFIEAYYCQPRFGGIMVWEGIYAYNNTINGKNFQNTMKDILVADSQNKTLKTCPPRPTTTTSSTGTPTPTPCCTKSYTIVSGDTCYGISQTYSISLDFFYALNPVLNGGANCGSLQIGQVVCIAGSVASCTTTSSTTTTTTSSTTTKTSSSSSSSSSKTSTSSTTASSTSSSTTHSSSSSSTSSTKSSSTTSMTSSASVTSSTSSTKSTSSSSLSSSTKSPTSSTTSSSSSSSKLYTSFGNATTSTMATTSPVTYTTTTTSVYTITSCPPTVTNCPLGHVTTDIITITTTYCPASTTSTPVATSTSLPTQYTTSIVYTTLIYTITACPKTVTDCPAKMGSVTTETSVLYTTICPIAANTSPVITPASTAPIKEMSIPVMSASSTTTLNTTTTKYSTITVSRYSSSSSMLVVQTMNVMPVAAASPTTVASASPIKPSTATFTGSAANTASLGVGGIMAVILCMVGWALM